MDDCIFLIYIDDQCDDFLEEYLKKFCECNKGLNVRYSFVSYNPHDGYEKLVYSDDVKRADVLIIDEKLFREDDRFEYKTFGSKAKLIMQTIYPYKKMIIITQEDDIPYESKVLKYNRHREDYDADNDPGSFYKKYLEERLQWLCKEVIDTKRLLRTVKDDVEFTVDEAIKDAIILMADGESDKRMPKKSDIDMLVEEVRKLINKL